MKDFILAYFIAINILSGIVCCIDKRKAIRHSWRISEKLLWILSLLGGSVGMYLTMHIIRHKTLHKRFMIGLPALIILQIVIILILTKFNPGHIIMM